MRHHPRHRRRGQRRQGGGAVGDREVRHRQVGIGASIAVEGFRHRQREERIGQHARDDGLARGMGDQNVDASGTRDFGAIEEVDEALSQKLSKLMWEGPESDLVLTENAQPAIMAASMAVVRVLAREGGLDLAKHARLVAGHREVTREEFARLLAEAEHAGEPVPEIDLLVRTGGEQRPSNFMLWQSAYAELCFSPVLWPDFSEADLDGALEEFASRQRRFGS